ncbi:MAG: DNA-3-methyladenine glycosylase [Candidatus Lokiarchaeota archaeon]|nr:DNA-3-methyladenine glycosylase [Candidatus Lokiarchaeota archaeon]
MKELTRLSTDFFSRDTVEVGKDILGRYLIEKTEKGDMIGKIVETEAYLGPNDKACHAYNYKKTEKTKVMYMKPGTFYVYYIYGMYFCLNVITEPEGIPCAIFIRKLFPIEGIELMKENRAVKIGKNYKNLVDGPSKLCMALNITKEKYNGRDSCVETSKLYFAQGKNIGDKKITLNKRIGIGYAEEDKDRLLRFTLEQDI